MPDHPAALVQNRNRGLAIGSYGQDQTSPALSIEQSQHGCTLAIPAQADTRLSGLGRMAVGNDQSSELVHLVIHAHELDRLVAFESIEGEHAASIPDEALGISTPAKYQPPDFGGFVVVEEDPCLGSVNRWAFLTPNDDAREPGMVGDHHPQGAVRFHEVHPLDREFIHAPGFLSNHQE